MRVGGTAVLLGRPRLVERLCAGRVAVVEAPGGFGKSTLCSQVLAALDLPAVRVRFDEPTGLVGATALLERGARRIGLTSLVDGWDRTGEDTGLAELVDRLERWPTPLALLVDDVHRAEPEVLPWLGALVERAPSHARVLVSGRRVGRRLASLVADGDAPGVGPEDLRFTPSETAEQVARALGRPAEAAELREVEQLTDGWPAAVAVAAARLAQGPLPVGSRGGAVLGDLVDALLAGSDPATRLLVARLAHLRLLSAEAAAAVAGPGTLDRLLDTGLPVRFRPDGWGELAEPVRDVLEGRATLDVTAARAVADVYASRGEAAEALRLLRRVGDDDGLLQLLAGTPWAELPSFGLHPLAALVETLPDEALRGHAQLLVHAAWAAEVHAPPLRAFFVGRADRVAGPSGPVRRLVDVERGRDLGRVGDLDGEIALTSAVLADAEPGEVLTRARAHLGRGRSTMVKTNVTLVAPVRADLEAAVALFRLAGEHRWAAQALLVLGFGLELHTGALAAARERVVESLSLLPAADASRAMTLVYAAECFGQLGDLDEASAALREAEELSQRLRNDDLVAYVAWQRADLAHLRRDRETVATSLDQAERHPGTWFDVYAGLEYEAHAAQMWCNLGDAERARRYLLAAEARTTGDDELAYAPAARARFEVMFGDPSVALELLARLEVIGNPRDRWLWHLLTAVAAHRAGDEATAAERRSLARRAAAGIGDPDRAERREPELLALLGEGAVVHPAVRRLRLLGGFEVVGDGLGDPPPGRPATLVKVLGLRHSLTVDEAVDLLWPDADLATGRARLRNLLDRLRKASGPVVQRKGDTVALADEVEVDVERFERAAAAVLDAPAERRAGLARQALAAYGGELLPADRYEDWAAAARERLQRRHLALVEIVAADAEARGDLDEALRLLDLAIEAEPLDTSRHVRAARALLRQGRPAAAAVLVRRAIAQEQDLGVRPSADLEALAHELT